MQLLGLRNEYLVSRRVETQVMSAAEWLARGF